MTEPLLQTRSASLSQGSNPDDLRLLAWGGSRPVGTVDPIAVSRMGKPHTLGAVGLRGDVAVRRVGRHIEPSSSLRHRRSYRSPLLRRSPPERSEPSRFR